MSKIQFWKQFTTFHRTFFLWFLLYSICQRYNFESNLQRKRLSITRSIYCIRYVKDTILKAIYNVKYIITSSILLYSICQRYNFESNLQQSLYFIGLLFTVFDMSKIQFWKQFTTREIQHYAEHNCIRYVKDTILKAIYNISSFDKESNRTVFDMSKIQFWKQFTTLDALQYYCHELYSICQRYNFESNLQQHLCVWLRNNHCIRYVKDTILKAIYNGIWKKVCRCETVFDMSKIQFWKQFTTYWRMAIYLARLYSICQRYNFESNLQHDNVRSKLACHCIRYVKDTILKAIYNGVEVGLPTY